MNSRTARGVIFRVAALTALLGVSGCVGYKVGSTLPPGIETIHVPAFVNQTAEPQVDTEATRAVIQEFQRDGTLRVTGLDEADATLEVTLVNFKLSPLRYQRDRSKATREYRLRITADMVFRRKRPYAILRRKRVQGESTFEVLGDLSTAKRTAVPEAARDLAHDIVEAVVETW